MLPFAQWRRREYSHSGSLLRGFHEWRRSRRDRRGPLARCPWLLRHQADPGSPARLELPPPRWQSPGSLTLAAQQALPADQLEEAATDHSLLRALLVAELCR